MSVLTTPNLNLPYPDGNELVSLGPQDFQRVVQGLDQGVNGPTASLYQRGSLNALPLANTLPIGSIYHPTNASCFFLNQGTTWHYVPTDGGSAPVGTIMQYAGNSDPVDPDGTTRWVVCDGRALAQITYPTLYGVIGSTYGSSGGNFNIPNARGKTLVGSGAGFDQNNFSESFSLGSQYGEYVHTLSSGESGIQSHSHGASDSGHTHTDSGHTHTDGGHQHAPLGASTFLTGLNFATAVTSIDEPSIFVSLTDQFGGNQPFFVSPLSPGQSQNGWSLSYGLGGITWHNGSFADGETFTTQTAVGHAAISTNSANIQTGHAAVTVGNTSANAQASHNNVQPVLTVNHIIRVQ